MHHIISNILQHTHILLNINLLVLINNFPQIAIDIVMKPILIPHNRIVLVEFTLHNHPQNLLIVR